MKISHHFGAYIIDYENGKTELIQTDYSYPYVAAEFGYKNPDKCVHRSTDGTIMCDECGKSPSEFIAQAREFIDGICE